ncbi:MAG: ThiF family adenylyltransferase [Paenibacillaceae bacterium]
MEYLPWYEQNPAILQEEIKAYEASGFVFEYQKEVKDQKKMIEFKGNVEINGRAVNLIVRYPDEYPYFRPFVFAYDFSLERHQHPFGKNLCVIPHDQYGWETRMTGAFLVHQAIRLLTDSENGKDAVAKNEVPAAEPWTRYIQFDYFKPMMIAGSIPDNILETGDFTYREFGTRLWLSNIELKRQYYSFSTNLENKLEGNQQSSLVTSQYLRLDAPPSFDLKNPESIIDHLKDHPGIHSFYQDYQNFKGKTAKQSIKVGNVKIPKLALVFKEENFEQGSYHYTLMFGVYIPTEEMVRWSKPVFLSTEEHFTRIPTMKPLYERSAAIVGMGSLGSAITLELAKCGLGSFSIVDYDTVEFGNLCRHTVNIDLLPFYKTAALKYQIHHQFPFAKVDIINFMIGQLPNTDPKGTDLKVFYEQLKDVDILIDASADGMVTAMLNKMAVHLNIPIVHAWVTNGAIGGRVLRTIPNRTGCYKCLDMNGVKEVASADIEGIMPRGCSFPTFTGTSFDIYEVATHSVRLVTNTLLNLDDPDAYDHIMIEHYPPKIETEKILKRDDCPVCGRKK